MIAVNKMRGAFRLLALVVCLSCGMTMKRAPLPIPPLVESVVRASEPDEDEQEDEYREAAEFYLLKRALPGGDLPIERYIEGKRHAGSMPLYSLAQRRFVDAPQKGTARDATFGAWRPLGPGNVGGRTRSFLIHPSDPNTMYAGSVGGGVWKTTDGGASWTPLSDFLPSIGISAMAMDPKNPDVLYAGTASTTRARPAAIPFAAREFSNRRMPAQPGRDSAAQRARAFIMSTRSS